MRRTSENVVEPQELAPEFPWPSGFATSGVIAVLEPLVVEARARRLRSVIDARLASVTVVMDAPHDPHNGAAVMRSCDAFGIQQLHVVPRDEPFAISTTVTRGSEKWVDVVPHASVTEAVGALRRGGFELVRTHPDGDLVPGDLAGIPRCALVVGNEHDGIREELEAAASRSVRVPMRGFTESLNLSVSAGILLAAATAGRSGDLEPEVRERLYARGLFLTVPRAAAVLAASKARLIP
jgi:tRNA (guanosine-2'-O-)-methyltransferase